MTVLKLGDDFPGLLPFRRGQRGRQHFIKLHRESDEAYLYVGSNPSLKGELQQALLRLINEGWSAEGEIAIDFNGQGHGANDAPYLTAPITLEIGRALLALLDPQNGAPLLDHLETLRNELAQILGLSLPAIQVKDNLTLEDNRYVLRVKGAAIHSDDLFLDRLFVLGTPTQLDKLEGWTTQDPILASRAKWIEGTARQAAEESGCTILGPLVLLIHRLRTVLAQASADLLDLQSIYELIDRLAATHPVASEPFLESRKALRYLQQVLKEFLLEGIPIKDLVTVAELAGASFDDGLPVSHAVESCRKALSYLLCSRLADEEGKLSVLALAPDWEEVLHELVSKPTPTFDHHAEAFSTSLRQKLEEVLPQRITALVTDPETRRIARLLLQPSLSRLAILATDELYPSFKVLVAGSVTRGSTKPYPEGTA